MPLQNGDRLPDQAVTIIRDDKIEQATLAGLFGGHRSVLFAVPGAFTPTCSEQHLPSFRDRAGEFAAKDIAPVFCLAVNDPFVLRAWARETGIGDRLILIADGSGTLTRALDLELDLSSRGLGIRSQRFAMIVDDMTVSHLAVESSAGLDISSAEALLAAL